MVRVNILPPKMLADQHLVAEYLEIMMLVGHTRKYSDLSDIPKEYCLGKGHIKFFKNKLLYLKKRHELIRKEMRFRGFAANHSLSLKNISKKLKQNWKPKNSDFKKIKSRILFKMNLKPDFYRYYGKKKDKEFFIGLMTRFVSSPSSHL